MRVMRNLLAAGLLGLIATTQTGCLVAAAAVGTGATVAYVRGDLDATVDGSTQQVADATVAAAKDMGLSVVSHNADSLGGKIVARTSTDDGITIDLKSESEKLTKVSIRAGYFGDNAMQQRMLDKIKGQLTASAATTRPSNTVANTAGNTVASVESNH